MDSQKIRAAVLLTALSGSPGAMAQDVMESYVLDQILNGVVVVRAATPGVVNQVGLGFIIGRSGTTVWTVTAAHVLYPNFGQELSPVPASEITVQRRNDARAWRPSGAPQLAFGSSDLAFLPIHMPLNEAGADLWREPVVVRDPIPGEKARIAGKPNEIVYDEPPFTVSSVSVNGTAEFDGLSGREGQSGGAIAIGRGLLGMYVRSAGQRMIPIATIQAAATHASIPWSLTETRQPPAIPVRVCIEGIAPESPAPRLQGPYGSVELDRDRCTSTRAGLYGVVGGPYTTCSPSQLALTRETSQRFRVDCVIDPRGMWLSSEWGYLEVSPAGDDAWRLTGFVGSSHGTFSGTLRGRPPRLQVQARSSAGAILIGNLTLETRRLFGRLSLNGQPVNLELAR